MSDTTWIANNKKDPQKKQRLGTVSKKITGGLNMFDNTNITLISDVVKDREMFSSLERSLTCPCINSKYTQIKV